MKIKWIWFEIYGIGLILLPKMKFILNMLKRKYHIANNMYLCDDEYLYQNNNNIFYMLLSEPCNGTK